jgi:hypothetical protein
VHGIDEPEYVELLSRIEHSIPGGTVYEEPRR